MSDPIKSELLTVMAVAKRHIKALREEYELQKGFVSGHERRREKLARIALWREIVLIIDDELYELRSDNFDWLSSDQREARTRNEQRFNETRIENFKFQAGLIVEAFERRVNMAAPNWEVNFAAKQYLQERYEKHLPKRLKNADYYDTGFFSRPRDRGGNWPQPPEPSEHEELLNRLDHHIRDSIFEYHNDPRPEGEKRKPTLKDALIAEFERSPGKRGAPTQQELDTLYRKVRTAQRNIVRAPSLKVSKYDEWWLDDEDDG